MKRSLRFAVLPLFLTFVPAPSQAHPGTGIVVDRAGRVFFTNLKEIWRLDPDGRLSIAVPNKHSHELYLDEHQNLWGEHLTYEPSRRLWWSSVWKLAPDGTFAEVLPPTQGFPKVFSPAMDRQGNRYFAEVNNHRPKTSRIVRKTPEGRIEFVAGDDWGHADGKGAAARFGWIYSMTVGPDAFLYLTDGPSVRKVSPEGVVSTLARRGDALKASLFWRTLGSERPLMGLSVDENGSVFVANYSNRSIVKISRGGRVRTLAKSKGPWAPAGVALDGRDVVVLEYEARSLTAWRGRARVRRLSPDGRGRTLAVTKCARR